MVYCRLFNPYARFLGYPEDEILLIGISSDNNRQNKNIRRLKHLRENPRLHHHQSRKIEKSNIPENAFTVNVDVQQFEPEEITVKVIDDRFISVEAKHEEKVDEHGSISRHFLRKFAAPEGYDLEKIQSKLSLDGVLTVFVPKIEKVKNKEVREIPIIFTGKPLNAVEDAPKNNNDNVVNMET